MQRAFAARPELRGPAEDFALQTLVNLRLPGPDGAQQDSTFLPDPALIESGLIVRRGGSRFSINHATIAAFLATGALARSGQIGDLDGMGEWPAKSLLLEMLSARMDLTQQVRRALEARGDPLFENIFRAARWLRTSSRNAAWRPAAMRSLASLLQQDGHPMALRARAMMALIASGDPGVALLLNQMLASGSESQQVLAALGLGYSQYGQAVASMSNLVDGSSPAAGRAACLAWALVHGGDAARQAAAEALARHADEGHAILKEASQMDNLLVRRACIAGLAQIQQSWAVQRVETMSLEDKEWVVRSAASQALDLLNSPERRLPDPLPGLAETPWLIAFASEHGPGVSPGKPAEELIRRALAEGNAAQKFAAIEYLGLFGQPDDAPRLLRIQQECDGALREAAFHALWLLAQPAGRR